MLFALVVLVESVAAAVTIMPQKPGAISLPVSRQTPARHLFRREAPNGNLYSELWGSGYTTEIQIGTPPQLLYLIIDTGSSETWVNPNCARAGLGKEGICGEFPRYDGDASTSRHMVGSTASEPDNKFSINYGVGDVWGHYVEDDVVLAGASVPQVRFGVAANSTALWTGIMGLGFGAAVEIEYNGIIDELRHHSVIANRDFSVAIGSIDSGNPGEIVFGGVDTSRYVGELRRVPIRFPGIDGVHRYWVTLTGVGFTDPGGCASRPIAPTTWTATDVFLDTGTTLSLLPWSLVDAISRQFPSATWDPVWGLYNIDCAVENQKGTVDLSFDGGEGQPPVVVRVPFREVVVRYARPGSKCYLGFIPSPGSTMVVGDTVLRAAFALFRQDQKAVYLAQYSDQGCGAKNIVALDWTVRSMPVGTCGQPAWVPAC